MWHIYLKDKILTSVGRCRAPRSMEGRIAGVVRHQDQAHSVPRFPSLLCYESCVRKRLM